MALFGYIWLVLQFFTILFHRGGIVAWAAMMLLFGCIWLDTFLLHLPIN